MMTCVGGSILHYQEPPTQTVFMVKDDLFFLEKMSASPSSTGDAECVWLKLPSNSYVFL